MGILVNFLMTMLALGVTTFVVLMTIGKWKHSSRNVKVRDLETLNQLALAAAKNAVEQFKSKVPVDSTCPECQQVIDVIYVEAPADSFKTKCKCQTCNRILRGVLGPPDWVLKSREHNKNKALKHNFLDAMFFVEHFNTTGHGNYFERPLTATDIFPDANTKETELALERARNLQHGQNAYVGAAFFESPQAFDKAVKNLKGSHPGFCDDVYETVIHDNIRGMR